MGIFLSLCYWAGVEVGGDEGSNFMDFNLPGYIEKHLQFVTKSVKVDGQS